MFGLDQVIRVGSITVAAIAKRSVRGHPRWGVSIHGTKCPVAILIRRADVTLAFEIDGPQIPLDNLEQRFPGLRAEFERIKVEDA